ncbi:MAG: cation:proton antiporter [Candidatus Woesearchaeota archaeon]
MSRGELRVDSIIVQFIYLACVLIFGGLILFLRRKAEGNKSFYKFILILGGMLLAALTFRGAKLFQFDYFFLGNLSVFLLVVLVFELSTRVNGENVSFTKKSIGTIFALLFVNLIIFTSAALYLLKIPLLHALVYAIIISAIEYFMVAELRNEGDSANPFILLIAFLIFGLYDISSTVFLQTLGFFQYLLIGSGMGIAFGILVFKSLKYKKMTWFHEVGLLAAALMVFLFTEYVNGSGLFAVMVMGIFFGNSHVRRKIQLTSFSPFIFKSLEMLIFLFIGFTVSLVFTWHIFWVSLTLFALYLILRFMVIVIINPSYSLKNHVYLTIAPKGMVFAVMILVLSIYLANSATLVMSMTLVLLYSLILSTIFEHLEHKKIKELDKLFAVLERIRFGRKRNLRR